MWSIWIDGDPIPQPRPRLGRGGRVYTPKVAVSWRDTIQATVIEARALEHIPFEPIEGSVELSLQFYLSRPAGHIGKRGTVTPKYEALMPTGRPDLDNLAKAVMDALTRSRAWLDDAQVIALAARKAYCDVGKPPGVVVRVASV